MVRHGKHFVIKRAIKARKYVFDFFVIFVSIISSFTLTEWQKDNLHRRETVTALKAVSTDLGIDTGNFNKIIGLLQQEEVVLMDAMNDDIHEDSMQQIKDLLHALRVCHIQGCQQYGYHYLTGNIRNPIIYNHKILHLIGLYHEFCSPRGNFGEFNKDFQQITFENHKKLFETFPNYLHPDTSIANQSIREGIHSFLQNPYWKARIGLTYRQISAYNLEVNKYAKELAIKIIAYIEKEVAR